MSSPRVPPVLVVEDSDEDYDTVEEATRRAGLQNELVRATTGEQCMKLLRGDGVARVRPALLLLDLNVPGQGGRDVLAEVKADEELRELPVVVLSTSSNPRDLSFCYAEGANAYHVKPVRYSDHLTLVAKILLYWLSCAILPGVCGARL